MIEIKHTLTHRHNTYCAAMIVDVAAIAYVYLAGGVVCIWLCFASWWYRHRMNNIWQHYKKISCQFHADKQLNINFWNFHRNETYSNVYFNIIWMSRSDMTCGDLCELSFVKLTFLIFFDRLFPGSPNFEKIGDFSRGSVGVQSGIRVGAKLRPLVHTIH